MQSFKNTGVTVMLLFLSYGVYQVIMKPMPEKTTAENIDLLEISDPLSESHSESQQVSENPPTTPQPLSIDFAKASGLTTETRQPESLTIQPPASQTIPRELLDLPKQLDQQLSQGGFDSADLNAINGPEADGASIEQFQKNDFLRQANNENNQFEASLPETQTAPAEFPTKPSEPVAEAAPKNQLASLPDTNVDDTNQFVGTALPPQDNIDSVPDWSQDIKADASVTPTGTMTNVLPRDDVVSTESQQREVPPLSEAWSKVEALVEAGNYQSALADLSRYYHQHDLEAMEKQRLLEWLDALAAKVIYSSEHHLRSLPYIIQPDDTIAALARDWQIPAQLIYNVNTDKIPDPTDLTPGVEIKMIQGPFNAEIDSASNTMTLFLDGLYAGRFSIGSKRLLPLGEFRIVDKSANDKSGRPYWIELNNGISIYGSNQGALENNEIALLPGEAEELFSILSATSNIRVVR